MIIGYLLKRTTALPTLLLLVSLVVFAVLFKAAAVVNVNFLVDLSYAAVYPHIRL